MTRDEVDALIREKEGRLCVRYYQRADGTILLRDCTVGVRRRRRRRAIAAGIAATLAGAAATGYVVHESEHEEAVTGALETIQGGIGPMPPQDVQGVATPEPGPEPVTAKMGEL